MNTDHLVALQERLSRERVRLYAARTEKERQLRQVWVMQAKREIEQELRFLGMEAAPTVEMSNDELLAALNS
jgi:hypothetical protein